MDALNNREIAILFWGFLFLLWCAKNQKVRESFSIVVDCLFKKVIIIPFLFMILYILLIIYLLGGAGIWKLCQLKNTIIWSVSVATVSFFKINEISEDKHFFKNTIKNNLKLVVVLEFIVSFYTFNLMVELVVIPLIILISMLLAFTQFNKEYKTAYNFLNNVMALFGTILIGYTVYKLASNISSFATMGTFVDFSLPPLMSLLFLPYIYCMVLFLNYDSVFSKLNHLINNHTILHYSKLISLLLFNFRIELLKRWAVSLYSTKIETKNDIKTSIRKIMSMHAAEKNPQKIPLSEGWSPYLAKDFLLSKGINTGYYKPTVLARIIHKKRQCIN